MIRKKKQIEIHSISLLISRQYITLGNSQPSPCSFMLLLTHSGGLMHSLTKVREFISEEQLAILDSCYILTDIIQSLIDSLETSMHKGEASCNDLLLREELGTHKCFNLVNLIL